MIARSVSIFKFISVLLFWVPAIGSPSTLLVLGDSVSAGFGLDNPAKGWVGLLNEALVKTGKSMEIANASISGETTAGGLARLDALLKRHRPKITIVELGANDGLRGLAPAQIEANLNEIVAKTKNAGSSVLLLGMKIPPNYGKRYLEKFEGVFPAVAARQTVEWVPFLMDGVGGDARYMQPDGLHPNADAQPLMLNSVMNKLRGLLEPH